MYYLFLNKSNPKLVSAKLSEAQIYDVKQDID